MPGKGSAAAVKHPAHKRPALAIRWQMMLFISALTLFTLALMWAVITYGLEPMYNRTLRARLENRCTAITAMIDQSDKEISQRTYTGLWLNSNFWNSVSDAFAQQRIDVDGACVDFSDATLHCLKAYESLFPCLLHDSSGAFGGEFAFTPDNPVVISLRQQLFEQGSLYKIIATGSNRQMVVGRLSADGCYGVLVSANLAQIFTAAEVLRSLLLPLSLVLLVIDLLAAMLFSRWITRPIHRLSAAAREVAAGNYDTCISVEHNDEIGRLAADFNHMTAEVKRSAQLEKDILANVSHDLRTPLTLIKGYAETVRDITGNDAEKRTEQCNIIADEADRLSALVNSVMELSKVQSGAEKPEPVQFHMDALCFEVAGRYDALCEQNHWQLQFLGNDPCPVSADPAMMERVLHNLLGNAFHHIGADGVVILRAAPMPGGGCRVEVTDHGPGIPPDDLPYIFDRYYRARQDSGRSGTGLGLSITKAILQQHGFAFGVNSAVGQGSTFWFEMRDTRAK